MLKLEQAPSAIPDDPDRTTYLVIDASRCKGHVFREVSVNSTDLEQVLTDLVEGQYVEPVRVVGFNLQEGWSRDVSAEVARTIKRRHMAGGRSLPRSLCKFIAEQSNWVEARSMARTIPGSMARRRRIRRNANVSVHDHAELRPDHAAHEAAE